MRNTRSIIASLVTVVILAATAIAGPQLLQEEIEQRVSGLEARVTMLEQQVADLQAGGSSAVPTPVPTTYTISGTMQLRQDFDEPVTRIDDLDYCGGTRGYDDIQTGANVVVLDGSGNTLATTKLETAGDPLSETYICKFAFTVDVPEADFYTVKIGRRGAPTYSFEEMVENDWTMALSIG